MNMEQYWRAYDKTLEPPDEPPVVAECGSCGNEFHEGEQVIKSDGEYFCDTDCLLNSLDYYWEDLGED